MQYRNCKTCGEQISILKDYCPKCKNLLEQNGNPPIYVCEACGLEHGEKKNGGAKYEAEMWKEGICTICKKKALITHYRAFGYLTKGNLAKSIDKVKIFKSLTQKKDDTKPVAEHIDTGHEVDSSKT
jgi:hypothetical protein